MINNKPLVFYLAIRLWSEDLKHLIPIPVDLDYIGGLGFKVRVVG